MRGTRVGKAYAKFVKSIGINAMGSGRGYLLRRK